jgi:benzoate/toluate 1,2-dioxygenase alpha subunit
MLEGNWKLWHENFRDNYHPMFTHQMIGVGYQGVKIEGDNYALSNGHSLLRFPIQSNPAGLPRVIRKITGRDIGSMQPPNLSGLATDDKNMIVAIFPNLDLQHAPRLRNQSSPTAQGHDLLQIVRPVSTNRSVVEIVVFGRRGEPAEIRQWRLANTLDGQAASGKISGDDTEAVRRCALGFGTANEVRWSNMDRGQNPGNAGIKNDEYSLRAFYVEYKKRMGAALPPSRLARAS